MTNKDIEKSIRNAFEKTVPDVLDSVLEQCLEQKGHVITMTENKKRKPVLKIAAIAAAAVVLLAMTVVTAAAITFTGLVDESEALGAAMNYVVQSAETKEEADMISNHILAGLSYDHMLEEKQVDLGLKNFRAVYSVSFRVGGYAYVVGVDAKTGVVISCEREIDEGWEEYLESEIPSAGGRFDPEDFEKWRYEIDSQDATLIARDYIGFYAIEVCGSYDINIVTSPSFGSEAISESYDKYTTYNTVIIHGGYEYSLIIDSVTGEVLNLDISEYDDYDGERHLHEYTDEYIGMYNAKQIFLEQAELNGDNYPALINVNFYPEVRKITDSDGKIVENGYGKDVYDVSAQIKDTTIRVNYIIDARTGEVLNIEHYSQDPTAASNQVPSTEAPDGMISEAVAKAIALEDSGIDEMHVHDFKIELDGKVYKLSYQGGSEAGLFLYTYEIDAENGSIISSNAEELA